MVSLRSARFSQLLGRLLELAEIFLALFEELCLLLSSSVSFARLTTLSHANRQMDEAVTLLEVWLLMRSLRTLHVRVRQQSATATLLAEWLDAARTDAGSQDAGVTEFRLAQLHLQKVCASRKTFRRRVPTNLHGSYSPWVMITSGFRLISL